MPDLDSVKIDKDPDNKKLPKELQECLKWLLDKYEAEDGWVRKQQIKMWKKNDEFWHGIQFIFWSESRNDWVSPSGAQTFGFLQDEGREESEGPFYDFVINIYKAHGESIIAALSSQIPGIRFPPDDAESEEDLMTSKTYSKISDLIDRHNRAKLIFLQSLFMAWNQGIICAYHAPKADKAFGQVEIPNYKQGLICQNCEWKSGDEVEGNAESDIESKDDNLQEGASCPRCTEPLMKGTVIDGFSKTPKTRVLIDILGPLHVKVPYTARSQKDFGYLIYNLDQPKALLKSLFPEIKDEIENDQNDSQQFERMARAPSSYSATARVDENRNLGTLRRAWLRPWTFEDLGDDKEKEREKLKELFPQGVALTFIGPKYAGARDEDLDKYWSVGKCGLSTYIHSDPMGQPLIPIQEMQNVLVNLTLETIEQGIPQTFADPEVLNFKNYSRHEARPGTVYPAKAKSGQRMGDSFYEGARASLSTEVAMFDQQLEKKGQFVSGSFPSIYGGANDAKSRTAAEYNMSRQMALQRLQIAWSFLLEWWAVMKEKCVHMYVQNMIEDERYVQKDPTKNDYINVWIRQSEMTGHVGEVEAEGSDSFPVSMPQKQAMFLKLLDLKDEMLHAAMFDPANRRLFADIIGFPDIEIPGENQAIKQSHEIADMLKTKQLIPIQPEVDDHEIHIYTLQNYLVDSVGLDLQKTNPEIYQVLIQHLGMHQKAQQANQDAAQDKQMKMQLMMEESRANNSFKRESMKMNMANKMKQENAAKGPPNGQQSN